MFPRQSSGQTPVLNRMGLDQLKALFDQSMQPGGDTQFDPYAVLSAIRSKTEEAKFAQAQRNMAAIQQNQAQGIGSLAQQIRREADMVQPSVNMARGGIVAFDKGGVAPKPGTETVVTPEVQAERDQIAARIRAQELKTPEAARAKLQQLDRAVAQATEADSKGIFERERRLTTQALRILESQGPVAALRRGVEALIPAAGAAPRGRPVEQISAEQAAQELEMGRRALAAPFPPPQAVSAAPELDPQARGIRSDAPIFGGRAIGAIPLGAETGAQAPAQSRSMELYPGAGTPRAPVEVPESSDIARIRQAVEDARAAVTKAEENLERFRIGTAGVMLQRQKPAEYQAALAASAAAKDKLRDAQLSLQGAYGPALGASSTPPPEVTSAPSSAPAASPAATVVPEAAAPATAGQADADATAGAPGQSPGGVSSQRTGTDVFTDIISRMAKVQEQQNANLQNRMSELRTRRGVPEEIAAGQAGIERIMAEQLANEQRINDQRMAEARKLYESRQTELTPSIARVLRSISSKPGALFESLGEGAEKEEQRVRTGKEEARKELTAAQRESDEAVRNMLKMRMLEAQRVQAIRENRQKDVDNIDDKIADLREKIDTQGMANLKTESEIRLHQLQYGKPSELQDRINLMLQRPDLYYKLYPPPDQKTATLDILKQMSTNYATLAKEVIDPKQKQIYLDQLTRVNTLLERFIGEPQIPPEAKAQLKEGEVKVFSNGQEWTLRNGQPVRLK